MYFPKDPSEEMLRDEIQFTAEDVGMPVADTATLEVGLRKIARHYEAEIDLLHYIFCSDEYLLQINREHLDHDTFTDIITFPYREFPEMESDIFISTERVAENAEKFGVPFERELRRVVAHGLLHLIGFGDKTEEEASEMRRREEHALALFPS